MLEKIVSLPDTSGVYQYFNAQNRLLYVGKAKNLKNRVKSYWRFTPHLQPNPMLSFRITKMLSETVRLEYIVTATESDALILENSLIKQLKPKYNILLRDDKTYPYIYIDEGEEFPRFDITRKVIKGKKIRYFGPFASGARELLDTIYEIFPLVQKKSCIKGKKACLFYQIERCKAPCEGKISKEEYGHIITEATKSISKRSVLIDKLSQRMLFLAQNERFEEAMVMRDRIEVIKKLTLDSNVDFATDDNYDIFAIRSNASRGVIVKIFMRDGKVISSDFDYFNISEIYDEDEAYKQLLLDFYNKDIAQKRDVLVAKEFEDMEMIEELLNASSTKKITLSNPKKGKKFKLLELVITNGDELLHQDKHQPSMEESLAHLLELSNMPYVVEVFDNSHMSGQGIVGGMVSWSNQAWQKSHYRHYNLSSLDEYAQMREMITRRIESFDKLSPPDLWIIDGGETLLKLVDTLLSNVGVYIDLVAIAKEKIDAKAHRAKGSARDIIYTKSSKFELKPSDKRLQWIQHKRDEAHRWAVTFHRKQKRADDLQSELLSKKGMGKATIKRLLDYFGSFDAIKSASFEELEIATNSKIAKIITSNNGMDNVTKI